MNPAIAVPYQLFSAILTPEKAVGWKFLYVLIPSLIGGGLAGLVMHRIYEPLLLYTKFSG